MTAIEQKTVTPAFKSPRSAKWQPLVAENTNDEGQQESLRKAKEELKNSLLASLQMQQIVVLAGSGCSLAAGGPSMADLWDAAVGKTPTQKVKDVAAQVHHDIEDKDIEALLSRSEAFAQMVQDGQKEGISTFLRDSKKVILDQCSSFLNLARLSGHKTFLHRLARRRARAPRLKVFTTNYDLCFECAAAELGAVVLDGFSFTAPRRHDPRFFGYDIVQRSSNDDGLGQYVPGVFHLYKLHGSVNWALGNDGVIYEETKPSPDKACLIYPARGKYQQSFAQPYLESIAQYLAAVREPNTCVLVVGFGFNDDHLSKPLLAAIETNPHLRVIVADPCAKANEDKTKEDGGHSHWKRLHELSNAGEDVWFINAGFTEFAQMIPDLKSMTPADSLVKTIRGIAREP